MVLSQIAVKSVGGLQFPWEMESPLSQLIYKLDMVGSFVGFEGVLFPVYVNVG